MDRIIKAFGGYLMEQLQRTYTKKQIRLIKRSLLILKNGKSFCFKMLQAKCKGEITDKEYTDTLYLNQRCPLHLSGQCQNCQNRIDEGGIDLYQAVRDIGMMRSQLNFDFMNELDSDDEQSTNESGIDAWQLPPQDQAQRETTEQQLLQYRQRKWRQLSLPIK